MLAKQSRHSCFYLSASFPLFFWIASLLRQRLVPPFDNKYVRTDAMTMERQPCLRHFSSLRDNLLSKQSRRLVHKFNFIPFVIARQLVVKAIQTFMFLFVSIIPSFFLDCFATSPTARAALRQQIRAGAMTAERPSTLSVWGDTYYNLRQLPNLGNCRISIFLYLISLPHFFTSFLYLISLPLFFTAKSVRSRPCQA